MDHNTGAQTPQESFSNPEPDFRQEPELQTQAPAQENFSWMENEDFDRLMNGDFGDLNFSEFLVPIEDSYTILKPEQRGEVPATSNNTTAEANVPSSSVSFEGLQALLDRVPEDLVAQLNEEFQSIADGRGIFTQGSEDQTLRDQDGSYIDPAQLAQRGEAGSFNTTHHQPSHANSVAADEGFTGLTTSPNPSSLEQVFHGGEEGRHSTSMSRKGKEKVSTSHPSFLEDRGVDQHVVIDVEIPPGSHTTSLPEPESELYSFDGRAMNDGYSPDTGEWEVGQNTSRASPSNIDRGYVYAWERGSHVPLNQVPAPTRNPYAGMGPGAFSSHQGPRFPQAYGGRVILSQQQPVGFQQPNNGYLGNPFTIQHDFASVRPSFTNTNGGPTPINMPQMNTAVAHPAPAASVLNIQAPPVAAPTNNAPAGAGTSTNNSFFQNGEQNWTVQNPPAILGMLDPPPAWGNEADPQVLVDNQGNNVVHPSNGLKVRNVPLPRQLPSNLSPLHMEAFMRRNSKITYHDFPARMPAGTNDYTKKDMNRINNQRRRHCREKLNVRCWTGTFQGPTKTLIGLLDNLTDQQIQHNTTWVVTPQGIHPPANPACLYPYADFLPAGFQQSDATREGLRELAELRGKALQQGLSHWSKLTADEKKKHEWRSDMVKNNKRNRRGGAPDDNNPDDNHTDNNPDDNDDNDDDGPAATGGPSKRQKTN